MGNVSFCVISATITFAILFDRLKNIFVFGIHNIYFLNNLMSRVRQSILDGVFLEFKEEFLGNYK